MVYTKAITVTKNTTETTAEHFKLGIARGVIVKWDIFFPAGSYGTTRIRVFRGSDLLLPRSKGGYIAGDDTHFSFPEHFLIHSPPYILDIYSWNIATDFDHEYIIYVSVVPFGSLYPFSKYYANVERAEELGTIIG